MMSPPPPVSSANQKPSLRSGLLFLAVLVGVLLLFFHRSFQASQVLFSNDGPLGQAAANYIAMPGAFFGMWQDLNWVGGAGGSALPNLTNLLLWVLGPLHFAKFYAPISLLAVGLAAWLFFRSLRFSLPVCALGALAATLNSDLFSYACWGLGTHALAVAFAFAALASLGSDRIRQPWLRMALAGFAVGLSVTEGFDGGAILSLYVAAFVVFRAWGTRASMPQRLKSGVVQLTVVAACAVWIATHALSTLIGTQIKGIVGMEQDAETKAQRWTQATQWSLPRVEMLRILIPGLYGYRMDTPEGGNYWGAVGRDPAWDAYLASPQPDPARMPRGVVRHSGAGFYAGVSVVLFAVLALVLAFKRTDSTFTAEERRLVRFWAIAALVSLILALGRHAPFNIYSWTVYQLPYFSTIRNPIKFLHPFSLSVVILSGYGLQALWRKSMEAPKPVRHAGFAAWWGSAPAAERHFVLGLTATLGCFLLGWMAYSASQTETIRFLGRAGFPDAAFAQKMVQASLREVGWSTLFVLLTCGAMTACLAGMFRGQRASWAAATVLGIILVADLARANLPWVVYYNYRVKYADNDVIRLLRQDAHERRVTSLFLGVGGEAASAQESLQSVYAMDWMQGLFPYNNIQSLDIVQEPRQATENALYRTAFLGSDTASRFAGLLRQWELTSTRFVVALAGLVEPINQQLDAGRGRFRLHTGFTLGRDSEDTPIRAITNATGPFGIIEFSGALPKASLFTRWDVNPDDRAVLKQLADPAFDPARAVLVPTPLPTPPAATNASGGTVKFESYAPKRIRLRAEVQSPSVLLLNDKHHPDWQTTVDGRTAPLLRCNYLMRGVYLPAGTHAVEFRFVPSTGALYVSLTAIAAALCLCAWLALKRNAVEPNATTKAGSI